VRKKKRILVITYWSYQDPLIQTYTLPYVRLIGKHLPLGSQIYLFTLEQTHFKTTTAKKNEIKQKLTRENIVWLPHKYLPFGFLGGLNISILIMKLLGFCIFRKINYLHSWCMPGGAIGYILSKITGIPLIIDSYEPHAEAMVENGDWNKSNIAFKILFYLEKLQSKRATHIIATTQGMHGYAKKKYNLDLKSFSVKPACVDLDLFGEGNIKNAKLLTELAIEGKIVCVYAGKFGGIYLTNEVFDFFKIAYDYWGDKFCVLLLTNHSNLEINDFCLKSGLPPQIVISLFVAHFEIANYIGLGDFAITPVKTVPTKRYCTPIKDGEYWAMGLPVVINKDISDDSQIIKENGIGTVLNGLDRDSYNKAVQEIDKLLKNNSRQELFYKIRKIAIRYRSFEVADKIYSQIYGNR